MLPPPPPPQADRDKASTPATAAGNSLQQILHRVTTNRTPRPALRTALKGWLGYVDAAILDWIDAQDLDREQLRDLLLAAFGAALLAAQQADRKIKLRTA